MEIKPQATSAIYIRLDVLGFKVLGSRVWRDTGMKSDPVQLTSGHGSFGGSLQHESWVLPPPSNSLY